MAAEAPSRGLWGWGAAPPPHDKTGAGLLLRAEGSGECLLLLRRSMHNDCTWGLPGGNIEHGDGGDLRQTALREAAEELGTLPPLRHVGSYLTHRGKVRAAA
jgi:8-oxo-dGTP pyrophosphatase MutT (NUDIX family)